MKNFKKIFLPSFVPIIFLSVWFFSPDTVFADTQLNISIVNDTVFIPSCPTQLPGGVMGYKAYVNDVEVFATGIFGGSPCGIGNDVFLPGVTPFITVFAGTTTQPAHLLFEFYQNTSFTGPVFAHFDVYYDGHTSTISPPQTGCVTDCFSNALFIPGLEASRLYRDRGVTCSVGCEDQLWEPNGNSDVEDLYLNTDGTSVRADVYTKDIISETNTPVATGFLGQNIYKSFSTMMDGLVTDQKIHEWRAFPYDWRMSVDDVVNLPQKTRDGQSALLIETLQALVDSSKSHKVTIIAHSNGGLVAKALLVKLQEMKSAGINDLIDHVDVLMLVAVPQIGTTSAVPAILHGYDQEKLGGLLMGQVHARELARNMSGAYGLLPSREYINHVDIAPITFSDTLVPSSVTTRYVSRYGATIDSYGEYLDFLFGAEGRSAPGVTDIFSPIILSRDLYSKAEVLHSKIDGWVPPVGLRVVTVAGWGLDTVAGFTYEPSDTCTSTSVGVCQSTLDERPVFTVNGDRTVVGPSAQYGGGEKVWVDLKEYNRFRPGLFGSNHSNILEVSQLNNMIQSLLTNNDISNNSIIKNIQPIDNTNRLHISIHSPVAIGLYDQNNNFTGKVCPSNSDFCYVQKDVTNSSYLEFGEGKYINVPEESMKKITLQGTGVGTFTFEVEKVLPSGQSTTTEFVGIPVTPQTSGEFSFNTAKNTPELKLDVTGDGVFDFILVSGGAVFDPVLYLQIMKKTIETLNINALSRVLLNLQIDTTIQALKKGKINKAKLKIEFFKQALSFRLKLPDRGSANPKLLSKEDAEKLITMLNQLLTNLNK